ncbi:hypothetical protein ACIQAD_33765 [Streptomyces sp. NPDC088551]|uniref:hypothetical protein n=1 Tax=Streptomyces sp. NPDC088551 TaxID=3365863 RepID=UPI003809A887
MDWRIRFAVLALIWGFSFLLIKVGTHGFAPFQVTFGRLFFVRRSGVTTVPA